MRVRSTLPAFFAATLLVLLATTAASADTPTGTATSPTLARASESGALPAVATADASTGVAHASIAFAFPKARGLAQPSLSLDYSAGSTRGEGGWGWSLSVPHIERRGVSGGMPFYRDGDWANPLSDRFYYNGTRLTPIGIVTPDLGCPGALPAEQFPTWAKGLTYFRPVVGDGDLRFFYEADGKAWFVQLKSGVTLTFGDVETFGAIGFTTAATNNTYASRWYLSVAADPWGNRVGYQYTPLDAAPGTRLLLTDIYDTPPAGKADAPAPEWAHHAHLNWSGVFPLNDGVQYPDGVLTDRGTPHRLLLGVDIASKTFMGTSPTDGRAMVRRYHLRYSVDPAAPVTKQGPTDPASASPAVAFLKGVSIEGACDGAVEHAEHLADSTNCPRLPETQYGYTGEDGPPAAALDVSSWRAPPISGAYLDLTGDGVPDTLADDATVNGIATTWEPHSADPSSRQAKLTDLFTSSTVGGAEHSVTVGDFSRDGQPNFLVWRVNPNPGAPGSPPYTSSYELYSLTTSKTWVGQGPTAVPARSLLELALKRVDHSVDVDGDGYPDIALLEAQAASSDHYTTVLTTRDSQGQITPFARVTENLGIGACAVPNSDVDVRSTFGDIDGDGLPDYVRFERDDAKTLRARVYRNIGNGQFGLWNSPPAPTDPCTDTYGGQQDFLFDNTNGDTLATTLPDQDNVYGVHDVTGDGLADIVTVGTGGLDVFARKWNSFEHIQHVAANQLWGAARYQKSLVSLRFADVNRSGVDDVVLSTGFRNSVQSQYIAHAFDVMAGVRPGLLTRVTQNGASTSIAYDILPAFEPKSINDWSKAVPQVVSIVKAITTTNGLPAPQAQSYTTTYSYENPVYDVRERLFEGFRVATVTTPGDASAPGTSVRTEFATHAPATVMPGSPFPPTVDYTFPMVTGLPVVIETTELPASGTGGTRLMTQTQTYEVINTYTGIDGAHTFIVRRKRADTHVFDRALQATTPDTRTVVSVASSDASDILSMIQDVQVSVPATGGKHLRIESTVDAFGNVTSETDFGEDGVDDPIQSRTTWVEPEETNRFIYRPETYETSYTTKDGVTPVGPVRAVSYGWGFAGELRNTYAKLSGSLPLDRSPLRGVPPLPPDASSDGDILLEQAFYDRLGNIIWGVGTNGRCTKTDFDTPFAELPVGTTVFAAGCDANPTVSPPSGGLTTARGFDRGFQRVTAAYSPSGRASAVTYDAFARPLTVYGPSTNGLFQLSSQPTRIDYRDSNDGGPSFVHVRTPDGPDESSLSVHETYDYFDPFGQRVVHLEQTGVGTWIASGYTERSANGRVVRAYEPYPYSGPVDASFAFATPAVKFVTAAYDGLGRAITRTNLDGVIASSNVYRPFETDHYDAEQLAGGTHVGAYATTRVDGHGRVVAVTRHLTTPAVDTVTTSMTYLATGEVTSRTESHAAGSGSVLRWMQYDSFGRLVLNVHPDTSVGFTSTIGTVGSPPPAGLKAWRYAYNDSGDAVGTSDPRGCGKNVFYDKLGRVQAEDYWPCTDEQPGYTAPDLTTGDGTEYFAVYGDAGGAAGLLMAESDRARTTSIDYDSRGRLQSVSRQVVRPNSSTPAEMAALASRYTPHVYTKTFAYDGANRLTTESTGADVDALRVNGDSALTTVYSARGTIDSITSSYGMLVDQLGYAPDGAVTTQRLGDIAHTTSSFGYDVQHRLHTVSIARPAGPWLTPSASYALPSATAPSTLEADLTEQTIDYDLVGNPTKIADATDPGPWPDGGKPITARVFTYDDSYRLATAAYAYGGPGGNDRFVSPYDAEVKAGTSAFPRLKGSAARVRSQSYLHDWLGNLNASDDDQHLMGERSLGTVTSGVGGDVPHRLQQAVSQSGGRISATYDAAGNVLTWNQTPCLLAGSDGDCALVSYTYTWDETNHLATAQRFETTSDFGGGFSGIGSPGGGTLDISTGQSTEVAYNKYLYAAGGERVVTRKVLVNPATGAPSVTYDVDVFASLRLQGAAYSGTPDQLGDFDASADTERVYLATNGITLGVVAFAKTDFDASGKRRVFFELGDHLGSTSFLIDQETSELVERPTYQAYGAAETDFRPDRWKNFRENFRFNGKLDDAEVGLAYYGARFLIPALGRWASPDPLEIHAMGADPNPYAFSHGAPTAHVDWNGLDPPCDKCGDSPPSYIGAILGSVGNFLFGGHKGGGSSGRGSAPSGLPPRPPTPPSPPPVPPTDTTPSPPPTPAPTAATPSRFTKGGAPAWLGVTGQAVANWAAAKLVHALSSFGDKAAYEKATHSGLTRVDGNPLTEEIVKAEPPIAGGCGREVFRVPA